MTVSALLGACAGDDMPKVQLPEIDTNNPLLAEWETPHATPPFDKISISDYEPAFETAIAVSRAEVDAIINNSAKPSFKNTILALEKQGDQMAITFEMSSEGSDTENGYILYVDLNDFTWTAEH